MLSFDILSLDILDFNILSLDILDFNIVVKHLWHVLNPTVINTKRN
jgi:hypothetical protein